MSVQLPYSEIIREVNAPLSIKLKAKHVLDRRVTRLASILESGKGTRGCIDLICRKGKVVWEYFLVFCFWLWRLLSRGHLWNRNRGVHSIESKYGVGVGMYFIFLDYLIIVNLCAASVR